MPADIRRCSAFHHLRWAAVWVLLLGLVLVAVQPAVASRASNEVPDETIRFVHLTDFHLFDAGEDRSLNEQAIRAAVERINVENRRARYVFAVVTGDLGVEALTDKNKEDTDDLHPDHDEQILRGAARLADLLRASEVPLWLFVPGNNDLLDPV